MRRISDGHYTTPPLRRTPPPHSLPANYITRDHMLVLHMALLEWLTLGTLAALWTSGCLHEDNSPPLGAHIGPYPCTSIAAVNLLPRGPLRLPIDPSLDNTPRPRDPHTSFPEAQSHAS